MRMAGAGSTPQKRPSSCSPESREHLDCAEGNPTSQAAGTPQAELVWKSPHTSVKTQPHLEAWLTASPCYSAFRVQLPAWLALPLNSRRAASILGQKYCQCFPPCLLSTCAKAQNYCAPCVSKRQAGREGLSVAPTRTEGWVPSVHVAPAFPAAVPR